MMPLSTGLKKLKLIKFKSDFDYVKFTCAYFFKYFIDGFYKPHHYH